MTLYSCLFFFLFLNLALSRWWCRQSGLYRFNILDALIRWSVLNDLQLCSVFCWCSTFCLYSYLFFFSLEVIFSGLNFKIHKLKQNIWTLDIRGELKDFQIIVFHLFVYFHTAAASCGFLNLIFITVPVKCTFVVLIKGSSLLIAAQTEMLFLECVCVCARVSKGCFVVYPPPSCCEW